MRLAPLPTLALAAVALLGLARAQEPQRFPRLTAEQAEILAHLSLVDLDDGFGQPVRTLRVTGLNVQLVNGLGTSASENGSGNLLLGYAETNVPDLDRRGSHNLVVGARNSYASHGALVVGERQRSEAPYAVVAGGSDNRAAAPYASVLGGTDNAALDAYALVVGGVWNEAGGGLSAILGGEHNTTSGQAACIAGGRWNIAAGAFSSVGGGANRSAPGEDDWVAGTLSEDE